jgi:hypothetical protein
MLVITDSRVAAYLSIGALVLLLVLAFLIFTGYLHYVHWKYSHIPQPNRPRATCAKSVKYYGDHASHNYSHKPDLTLCIIIVYPECCGM